MTEVQALEKSSQVSCWIKCPDKHDLHGVLTHVALLQRDCNESENIENLNYLTFAYRFAQRLSLEKYFLKSKRI